MPKRRATFLDRDGTLVEAIVNRPGFDKKVTAPFAMSELKFVPDLDRAMEIIKQLGYLRIIITNQPDVAYGYLLEKEWLKIHNTIIERAKPIDYFMCRHRREDGCPLKKPSPLMILAAADKWDVDLSQSFMIGDTSADTEAGKSAGCKTILINRGYNADVIADFRAISLLDAVHYINWLTKI